MRRSIISLTRDSNCSFTTFFLGVGHSFILTSLSPPALQRTVTDKKPGSHVIWSHYSDDSRPGQEVRRELRVLQSLRLDVKGGQRQKHHRANHPTANETECCSQQSVCPLQLRELHESGDQPDDQKSGKECRQEDHGETK